MQEAVADLPAALTLTATAGPCEGTTYAKAGLLLTVGRTRASKLHIKDSAVSEKHAELRWEGGNWNLADVGSSNGTAVNGKKLTEGNAPLISDLLWNFNSNAWCAAIFHCKLGKGCVARRHPSAFEGRRRDTVW
jgi:pSer/pThr/pTyr-binding forkhead associated (FHA) protein